MFKQKLYLRTHGRGPNTGLMVLCLDKASISTQCCYCLLSRSPTAPNNSFLIDCMFSQWIVDGCNNSNDDKMLYPKLAGQATFEWMPTLTFYGLRQSKNMYTRIF